MKNQHIRILLVAFMACNLLLAVACGKENVKTTGNLEPILANVIGTWRFDSLAGYFANSTVTFRDSLKFSAYGHGFEWELDGNIVKGTRYLDHNRTESVRMLIKDMRTTTGANGTETTMVVEGYFAQSYISNPDTVWTFGGNLKK